MKNKFLLLKISIVFLILMFLSGCVPKDTTPPSVSITSPLNNATVSGSVDIIASATDDVGVSKVEFYIDGTKVGEDSQAPYVYSWDTDTLQYNSTHSIKAKAYDNAGNIGESQVVTVTIGDTQAPQITITNPNNGDTVSGIVSIEAQVVDKVSSAKNKKVEKAPSGISKVEFYIDGINVEEDTEAPYEYSWDTDTLQYGSTHSIKAKAYDNAGNTGESQIVTVTIGDTQAPQVTITNPNDGDTVSGIVSIEATVVDKVSSAKNKKVEKAPSGILKVEFYVDGTKVGEDSQAPYEYSWNTDLLQYGSTHSIKAKAYDNAGNVGESQVVTVTIGDPQAPQVTITNPNNGDTVSGIVSIEAQVVDKIPSAKNKKVEKAPSGISKVEFYVDGTKVGEATQSPYVYSWNTTQVSNGGHTIKVKAYDNAGNSDSATITVYVNNSGVITWQKTYGGSYADGANSIQQTRDGGYIAAGYTKSYGAGGSDVYILKLNASGNLLWQKTFGGSGSELAYSIQQTTDGGYIVAGYTDSFGAGSSDIYVLKLDESGNATWTKTFGGSTYDYVGSIQQTTDGGYIVAGWTASSGAGDFDAYILKLDESGNTTWTKTFGGSTYDYAYSIQQTTDGGYIVAGTTLSFGAGNADGYVLKLDENGNLLWDKTFGGSDYDYVYSIQQTTDGGYIVAGSTSSFGVGYVNVYVLKLDENGNLLWDKTFGRSGSNGEAHSIKQVADGGYIVAGTLNYHAYVLKLDENGNLLWEKTFGGSNYDHAYSIQQTTDGGYIVAGSTSSFGSGDFDAYVLKLDENGNTGPYPTISKFQLSPSPLKKR